jgi:predicted ATPase
MGLLTTLGVALGAMQGMGAPEVGQAHARAYEIWKRLGARPNLFSTAGALWTYPIVAGQLDVALAVGEELLQMADATGNRAMQVTARHALGITLLHLGDYHRAAEHFDRGIKAYSPELHALLLGLPLNPAVACTAESSRVLWVLGYPDQAVRRAREASELAVQVAHPESIAFAALFGSFLYQFLNDGEQAREYGDTVLEVSRERDVATTLAWGLSSHGWALGKTGRLDEGIAEIRESLARQRAAGSEIARPQFAWMLGDICLRAGRCTEAQDAAHDGLRTAAKTGNHYWDSELRRLEGEILVRSGGDASEAEKHFLAAMADASARGAKSLELRAATSLARLWASQHRKEDAARVLAPVYAWFTEGLETADLVAARELLDDCTSRE